VDDQCLRARRGVNAKGRPAGPLDARGVALSIRTLPVIREALERAAKEDRRTVAAMAKLLLEAALKEKGYLK
jgi:hypothetical protein